MLAALRYLTDAAPDKPLFIDTRFVGEARAELDMPATYVVAWGSDIRLNACNGGLLFVPIIGTSAHASVAYGEAVKTASIYRPDVAAIWSPIAAEEPYPMQTAPQILLMNAAEIIAYRGEAAVLQVSNTRSASGGRLMEHWINFGAMDRNELVRRIGTAQSRLALAPEGDPGHMKVSLE